MTARMYSGFATATYDVPFSPMDDRPDVRLRLSVCRWMSRMYSGFATY